jgi:hypothetical protein
VPPLKNENKICETQFKKKFAAKVSVAKMEEKKMLTMVGKAGKRVWSQLSTLRNLTRMKTKSIPMFGIG